MAIRKIDKGYVVDIKPGGRRGKRIRQTFLYHADALAFERKIIADWQRGTFLDKGKRSGMLFSDYVDLFIERYAQPYMRKVEASEIYRLREFKTYFQGVLGAITHEDGAKYVSERLAKGDSPGTINRKLTSLKRIFSWALSNDDLHANPFHRLKKLKAPTGRVRWLTAIEIGLLLNAAKETDEQLVPLIIFALNTGFRKGNLLRASAADIHGEFITALETKSGHPYDVPINETLARLLPTLPAERFFRLPKLDSRFRSVVKRAGFWKGPRHPDSVSLHTLRHTFIAHCLQRGIPIYTVGKWAGHASVKITEAVYGHLSPTHHTQEMKKFPGLGVDAGLPDDPKMIGPYGIRTRDLCLERIEN